MYFPNPADPNAGPTPQITDDPHRTGQNLAFLDGHGEFVHWEDQRAKTFGLEVLEGGTWTGDGYEAKVNGYATVARLAGSGSTDPSRRDGAPRERCRPSPGFAPTMRTAILLVMALVPAANAAARADGGRAVERQLTRAPHGHVLTNAGVWSPDARWVVYDTRSDPAGTSFDGTRIEKVNVDTGEVVRLYESTDGAHVGVVTYSPVADRVVFIHGPERPTPDWTYGPAQRRGVVLAADGPGATVNLDARNLVPPFTPGALRGGSHVRVFGGDGRWVSFTYEDHVLSAFAEEAAGHDVNLRCVGVSAPAGPVTVGRGHPRNHDGSHFSVVVTRVTANPRPGSDEISRAFEDAWVGTEGYARRDGTRQRRALGFQGHVRTAAGETVSEAFVVDLPDDVTAPGDARPLEGTATRRPAPPKGAVQRRLTFTATRKHPGMQGPRYWLRSAPDGSRVALLMKDDAGVVQLWTVSPNGDASPVQVTRNAWDVASAFTWSPDGRRVAYVMDNSVFVTDVATGEGTRLTPRSEDDAAPRPEACVFSPDGRRVAYVRTVGSDGQRFDQVFAVTLAAGPAAPEPPSGKSDFLHVRARTARTS